MNRSENLVVLVHLHLAGRDKHYYWSDAAYTDWSAYRCYDPRIVGEISYRRGVSCILWGGKALDNGLGVIELANDDGALDELVMGDQSGGTVQVSIVAAGDPISSATLVATVDVARVEARGERAVRIVTESVLRRLDRPFAGLYTAGDAHDPPASLVGKPKPWALGRPLSCPIVLVNPVDFEYDVHDQGGWAVAKVRDGGIELSTPAGWIVSTTTGVQGVELQYQPISAVVADVVVDGPLTLADAISTVIARANEYEIDVALDSTLSDLDEACPWPVSVWVDTATTFLQVLTSLLDSVCGWMVPNAEGGISLGRLHLPDPEAEPDLVIDEVSLAGDIEILPDAAPGLSTTFAGQRNYRVYADSELADDVTSADRTLLTADYRLRRTASTGVTAELGVVAGVAPQPRDADVLVSNRVDGRPLPGAGIGTLLDDATDLQTLANHVAGLYPLGGVARFVKVPVFLLEGAETVLAGKTTVLLRHPRFGFADGVLGLVVDVDGRVADPKVTLTVRVVIEPSKGGGGGDGGMEDL